MYSRMVLYTLVILMLVCTTICPRKFVTAVPVPYVCPSNIMSLLHYKKIISVDENIPAVACPRGSPGGQCVALPKCECNVAHTSHWIPGRKVMNACNLIPYGTVIATFDGPRDQYRNRATDHAAIFAGCFARNGVQYIGVFGQGCSYTIRYGVFRHGDIWHDRFYEVTCDRSRTSCDSPTARQCHRRFRIHDLQYKNDKNTADLP